MLIFCNFPPTFFAKWCRDLNGWTTYACLINWGNTKCPWPIRNFSPFSYRSKFRRKCVLWNGENRTFPESSELRSHCKNSSPHRPVLAPFIIFNLSNSLSKNLQVQELFWMFSISEESRKCPKNFSPFLLKYPTE